ncbi:Flp family type IVb pilin [Vibrio agarivorans]|uniref:Flp family type IVb pilin n=1 Tax=Vibrio agarivorans TaxID=153622 RepID=UPI00222F67AD|nr:Flp family type IVb pilin [Vibrio agarivorans]
MITKLYVKTANFLTEFKNDERGVTAIEYGLIATAMAVVLSVAFADGAIIGGLADGFDSVKDTIEGITDAAAARED